MRLMRVLVVEDDRKTAAFISKALKAESFAVDVLRNGDEALAAICTTAYDAVVMDIMIGGRDGLSVLQEIRAKKINTPVIILSARASVDDRPLTTNKKVREAELARINYILVVGDREVEATKARERNRLRFGPVG